jgi:hypothetical protein
MMWVITLAGALVFLFAGLAARALRPPAAEARARTNTDAVLFWGVFALAAGFLGTTLGLYMAALAIERAGEVAPALAWGGFKVTLITTQAGLVVFMLALLLWFGLWYATRRRTIALAERA